MKFGISETNARLKHNTHRLQAYRLTDRATGMESSQFMYMHQY